MESVQTGTGKMNGKDKKAAGRKDKRNQPAVIEVAKLREDLTKLKRLKTALDEASEDFNGAVTKSAEKSGLLSSVVRKVVNAYTGENFEEEHRKVEQMSLAFEEIAKA
ncbi:MAG: hypothetical protein Q8P46_18280 [Hyphomicrobiales bacterium]|nr:hypothetical protein [Hyphomicrobiales bacterium]